MGERWQHGHHRLFLDTTIGQACVQCSLWLCCCSLLTKAIAAVAGNERIYASKLARSAVFAYCWSLAIDVDLAPSVVSFAPQDCAHMIHAAKELALTHCALTSAGYCSCDQIKCSEPILVAHHN